METKKIRGLWVTLGLTAIVAVTPFTKLSSEAVYVEPEPTVTQEAEEILIEEKTVYEPEVVVEEIPFYYEISDDNYISEDSIRSICRYVGNEYGIEPELLMALAYVESTYKVTAKSSHGAYGLCQIIPKWHQDKIEYLEIDDIWDPYSNILLCAEILDNLKHTCKNGNSVEFCLMAYNMGASKANELYSQGVVSKYAKKILNKKQELGGAQ